MGSEDPLVSADPLRSESLDSWGVRAQAWNWPWTLLHADRVPGRQVSILVLGTALALSCSVY